MPASASTVARTSIALRPRRSNFVTTNTSPDSSLSMSFPKPTRSEAATDPEAVSVMVVEGRH